MTRQTRLSVGVRSLDELYHKYPVNTIKKFQDIAVEHGFTRIDARKFLNERVIKDNKIPPPQYMHIYSKVPNAYQMDTFINDKKAGGKNYLIFINVNTRKAYAYEMKGKGADEVLKALNKFIEDVPNVSVILSDQDKAYLSQKVLLFMKDHNIHFQTTLDNDHNKLGIINRLMRTIRDMKERNNADILEIVESYNNIPHVSLNGKSPNKFTDEDEQEYIKNQVQNNPYDFQPGQRVRLILDKNPLRKVRTNLSKVSYIIDSRVGNQFIIKAKDDSIDTVPGYKIHRCGNNIPLAQTIKEDKRGLIKNIIRYINNGDKYEVEFEGGVIQMIPSINLREGNPTKLSRMEREYWIKQKVIPVAIRKWL